MSSKPAPFNPNHLDEHSVTHALAAGEHAAMLQAYFGEPLYAHLQPLARKALATPADSRTVVYVLPGLLGSRLGHAHADHSEVLWLDPAAVIAGRLAQMTATATPPMQALGIMLPGYLLLTLCLRAAGLTVRVFPYDWRRSVVAVGQDLARAWQAEAADQIMVVAHSLGGLVARCALAQAGNRVTRVVQMGTPNQGSYALLQALRAVYPTVRKLAAIDQTHSAEQLTLNVFRSFPSFYELLPRPLDAPLHWLNPQHWPTDALLPLTSHLHYAVELAQHMAPADARCHSIVGTGQFTVCGVRAEGQAPQITHWSYDYQQEGDGTVPFALAHWAGAQHWYAPARHGWLPLNAAVNQAVVELLLTGRTSALPSEHVAATDIVRTISEAQLRSQLTGKVRWDQLPMNERRELLEPSISDVFAAACR